MFAGLFRDRVILRLSPEDREELGKMPGAAPFEPMPGRRMREYMVAPASVVDSGPQLRAWLHRARTFAATLPPKDRKKPAKKPRRS
jgi:TfoX/Sxy family transcriptional regulator of competence genes